MLLSQFATSLLFHVWFYLLLLDLHTDFSGSRSGGLVFPSLKEFSTACCDHTEALVWSVKQIFGKPFSHLSILYMLVWIRQSQSPNLSIHLSPLGNHKLAFYIHNSISILWMSSFVPFILDSTCKPYHMISVFLCLTDFTYTTVSMPNHVAAIGI